LAVLVLIAPFLIPVNQFRPTIEEKASAALGRKVLLGDLSLSLLSGSLAAENLSIGEDPKFSSAPFLTARSLKVGVELMPLIFSKTLNITGVPSTRPRSCCCTILPAYGTSPRLAVQRPKRKPSGLPRKERLRRSSLSRNSS